VEGDLCLQYLPANAKLWDSGHLFRIPRKLPPVHDLRSLARWQGALPQCGSEKVTYLENAKLYRCYGDHPKQKFSLNWKFGNQFAIT